MADSPSPKKYTLKNQSEEGMEQRLIVAFLVLGLLMAGAQFFLPKPAPKPPAKPVETAASKPSAPVAAAPSATPVAAPVAASAAAMPTVAARAEERITIETGLYEVVFSNHGAVVESWKLTRFQDKRKKPLDVVNNFPQSRNRIWYPFQVDLRGQTLEVDPNYAYWVGQKSADGLGVEYTYSNGKLLYRKTFRFQKDSYLTEVTSELRNGGAVVPHSLAWRGGFGDFHVFNAVSTMSAHRYQRDDKKLTYTNSGDLAKKPEVLTGPFAFAGLQDIYFALALFPKDPAAEVRVRQFADESHGGPGTGPHAHPSISVGTTGNAFRVFVGPKQLDLLDKVDARMAGLVDFGWFEILSRPLFYALRWMHNSVTQNWGWAIILLTMAINLVLVPLKISGYKSSKKMQALQPEIAKINKRYEGVSMRDPRNQKKNEEIMALYQKHNVSLGGGCVPLLVQLPFLYAFFYVLRGAIELRGADWAWITDLSQPETLEVRILPSLMVVSGLILQRMTPISVPDPEQAKQQQMMFLVMQVVLGFTFWNFSSGLVLYWLTGNLMGLLQQWVLNKVGDRWGINIGLSPPAPASGTSASGVTSGKAPVTVQTAKKTPKKR
jgi:YidC/Oxa1 family membrane protein insertase